MRTSPETDFLVGKPKAHVRDADTVRNFYFMMYLVLTKSHVLDAGTVRSFYFVMDLLLTKSCVQDAAPSAVSIS